MRNCAFDLLQTQVFISMTYNEIPTKIASFFHMCNINYNSEIDNIFAFRFEIQQCDLTSLPHTYVIKL
jgi:hypothetical protein